MTKHEFTIAALLSAMPACVGFDQVDGHDVKASALGLTTEALATPSTECTAEELSRVMEIAAHVDDEIPWFVDEASQARWLRWFGRDDAATKRTVSTVFVEISGSIHYTPVCERKTGSTITNELCLNPNLYAFVDTSDIFVMHLCPGFFGASLTAQTNILVHEAAHLAIPDFHDYAGPRPGFTNASFCLQLAQTSPDLAIKNAANYGHFFTDDANLAL